MTFQIKTNSYVDILSWIYLEFWYYYS